MRRLVRLIIALVGLLGVIPPTLGQSPRFEEDFAALMESQGIDGVVVMVVEGDDIRYRQGFGVDANGAPIDPLASYDVGYVAEAFLATALLQQHERQPLMFKSPVQNVLPDFVFSSPQADDNVTLESLLTHTAGIGSQNQPPLAAVPADAYQGVERTGYPGSRYSWCTRCNSLLTLLLENLAGKPIDLVLQNWIFNPLQMDSSRVEVGRLLTTTDDLARFMSVHLQNGRWRNTQILTPDSITTLHRGYEPTARRDFEFRGYGWFVYSGAGLDVLERPEDRIVIAEDIGEFRAMMALIPAYRQGIVLLTDQPTTTLEPLMLLALDAFADWQVPEFRLLFDEAVYAGNFERVDGFFSERLELRLEAGGFVLDDGTRQYPAAFIDQQTLAIDVAGQVMRFYFTERGASQQAILSINGETTLYNRMAR